MGRWVGTGSPSGAGKTDTAPRGAMRGVFGAEMSQTRLNKDSLDAALQFEMEMKRISST